MLQRLKQDLKNDLIAGFLVVIPLATTIWLAITIAKWVIDLLTRIPKQVNPFESLNPILTNVLNLAVGFAVPLLSILVIGLMARNIVGRWLLDFGEQLLQAIPLAGSVYKTLKQILETLLRDSKSRFSRVVMVEYPRKGIWTLGFVTGAVSAQFQAHISEKMISVFIPTTPNPTSGWYAMVPEEETIDLAISIEDAFKVLISGGIVNPEAAETLAPNLSIPLPKAHQKMSLKTPVTEDS
ncbi:hypothetical protein Xen7305DRAFT_00015730 [Xenococcus sp. PCC 7305]|uniref:DUF502 domain-containing protein n=1 Tax=Xenococcus sp. PCC 7305 TaxID=102125 RepID=UPI0002ACBCC2|nr:DUF502 domain-containing protein [Xenococcus sp. PCC 7305]ELS01866.1 hypothetical protein Xen7305DRAFT_00015730 [Xenococcus sp. PCC 7305]